jgi:hypothetical protein
MAGPAILKVAYFANIVILVPVCWGMFAGGGVATVFQGQVAESAGLRLLVGSLWAAILLASIAGLVWPLFFAPVLLIQIVYKTLWLAVFVAPLVVAQRSAEVPWGVSTIFALIVLTYPVIFWLGTRP